MIKKWVKRGLILGTIAIIAYVFLELFFLVYLAERRFLKEEKIATQTYFENKNTFDNIRLLSAELPNYDLELNEKGENHLTLNLKESNTEESIDNSHFYYFEPQFSQGPIETLSNGEKWLIKIENAPNDTVFQETLIFFKKNFIIFEEIRNGIMQINSTHISNKKNSSLHILFKEEFYEGLRYSHYHLDRLKILTKNEYYFGEKIDTHFYFNLYAKNSLYCGYSLPVWMIPESRYE